jgi:DNA-directed RNA polymerase, mitochondrial
MSSRHIKDTADVVSNTAAATDADGAVIRTIEEDEELEEGVDRPPAVSVLSREQVLKLLNPSHEKAKRAKSGSASVTPQGKTAADVSLEGKFVDLVDLLPPVPTKGEFDVNKIKSSLYFFS